MGERLNEPVRTCHEHAADARHKAEAAADPESKASLLDIEKRWLALARNYALTERIGAPSTSTSERDRNLAEGDRVDAGLDESPRPQEIRTLDPIERSSVEAALRESEERLRWLASIVDSSDDAIISKTLDAIITSWNKGAERMFGYTAEEALGKPVTILIPPDRQHEERIILERIGRGERIEHYETVRERKDGSLIAISLTISPIKDVEGRIVGASKIARDITERKQAEARENILLAELAHLNRVATAGELSTSIAHELNQPLTSISLNAETAQLSLASEKPDIGEVRDALDEIVDDCLRAKTIITNLKSMFRKETGDKSEADTNKLIRTVMGLVSADLRKHQIELKMELNDQLPSVLANHVQIQQVILNLVMNAIDAMGSVHPRVLSVKSKLTGLDSVHVSIEDTGIGIGRADVDKLFEPLFTTKEHGMGMGLSICRSIIEHHGGRIWASPGVSRGTILQFELPTGYRACRNADFTAMSARPQPLQSLDLRQIEPQRSRRNNLAGRRETGD
jgi:PAS domain S-box-containing protein